MEVVNLRLKLELAMDKPDVTPEPVGQVDATSAYTGDTKVVFPQGEITSAMYQREKLHSGHRFSGPALVLQMDATTVLPPQWKATVDPFGNLLLEPE